MTQLVTQIWMGEHIIQYLPKRFREGAKTIVTKRQIKYRFSKAMKRPRNAMEKNPTYGGIFSRESKKKKETSMANLFFNTDPFVFLINS